MSGARIHADDHAGIGYQRGHGLQTECARKHGRRRKADPFGNRQRSRPFLLAACDRNISSGTGRRSGNRSEPWGRPQSASVGSARVDVRDAGTGCRHPRRQKPQVAGLGLNAVPVEQSRPARTLGHIFHPGRSLPLDPGPAISVSDAVIRPESIQSRAILWSGPMEVHGHVDNVRRHGNRYVQSLCVEQFAPTD